MKSSISQRLVALAQALPAQLIAALIGLILVTSLLSWFPEIWLIQEQLDRQAWSQVNQGRRITQSLYQQRAREIDSQANYLSQLPEVRQLLTNGVSREPYLRLSLLSDQLGLDLLGICDAQGNTAVQLGTTPRRNICDANLANGIYVSSSKPTPEAWWLATQPVGNGLGMLYVGTALNDRFAVQLSAQTGLEHTIIVDDRPIATSLARVAPATPDSDRHLLPPPNLRAQEDAAGESVTFAWQGVPYYASQVVLLSPNLIDEVALDVTALSQVKQRIVRSQMISLIIVGLTGILIAILFARHISRSLSKLAQAANQFSTGDLQSPVVIAGGVREVTQVAQALEQARQDLRHMVVALQHEKAWGEHLLQAIVEGIATIDAQGNITFWSQSAERITGWQREQVLQRNCDHIFPNYSSQPQFSQPQFSTIVATTGKHQHFTVLLADGSQATLDVVSAPLEWSGAAGNGSPAEAYQVVMFRDISEEVAVQRILGHFMANMTHEFRTPLSAVAAAIELLLDQTPELSAEELQELLLSLHLGVLSLQTLVDNLLESASLESGVFEAFPRPYDLAELVEEAAKTMHPLLAKYGQRLLIDLPPAIPLVYADPGRTIQVLVNLIANSSKYGPPEKEVVIGATISNEQICITVADRGSGIPVHQRQKIFSRFVHFDSNSEFSTDFSTDDNERNDLYTTSKHQAVSRFGTGLGLWIVKSIVEAQGGAVGVDARPGGGSIFWFTLGIAEER